MNINILKNNKSKIILLILTLIMFMGISLAAGYFIYVNTDTRDNTLITGLITIDFQEGSEAINLENQVPVIDDIGLTNTPYEFTVTNTSQVPINLKVELIPNTNNTLPIGAVRYALYINDELMTIDNVGSVENNILYTYNNFEVGKTINCKLIFWIDYYYETSGETFNATIKVEGESFDIIAGDDNNNNNPPGGDTAATTIKANAVNYSEASASDFSGGLVAINGTEGSDYGLLYNETNQAHTIREYRYVGPTVNNYIYYNCPDTAGGYNYGDLDYDYKTNCEVWRIVGIFKEDGEEYLKIMRNTTFAAGEVPTTYTYEGTTYSVGESTTSANVYWNKKSSGTKNNDWTTAGLQYYLNTEKDESTTSVAGYLSTVSTTSKSLIRETTYYLGNVVYGSDGDTTLTAYDNERKDAMCASSVTNNTYNSSCNIWSGNQPDWNGKVALLYPSDYGYSALSTYWSGTILLDYYEEAYETSWMQQTTNHSSNEWLLSPTSNASGSTISWYSWNSSGYLSISDVDDNCNQARPILNLKSQTEVLKGNGTSNTPYVVIEQ